MSKIFRLRPSNEFTIDELESGYLWFSRPTEYKDNDDANIIGFAEANENVKDAFNRVFSDYLEFGRIMSYSGICCFTESLPKSKEWKKFPKGHDGIFIEYDKEKLEQHFMMNYALGDCFKKVEYIKNQLLLKSSNQKDYDILWENTEDGGLYKSLKGEIERNERVMDQFLLKLLTRINKNFEKQKELRIILGGRNIPDSSPDVKGYKIHIPKGCITAIYIQANTPINFLDKLKLVTSPDIPIINMTKPKVW